MANLAYRSSVAGGDSSFGAATITATVPSGAAQNDLEQIWYSSAAIAPTAAPTHTTPSGWTAAGTTVVNGVAGGVLNVRLTLYYRVAPATPANATLTSSANAAHAWTRLAHDNVDTTTPFGQVSFGSFTGTSVVATSITTSKASALIAMYVAQGAAQSLTPDGSLTERIDTPAQGIEYADAIQATAGATGNKTATAPASSDGPWGFAEFWSEPHTTTGALAAGSATVAGTATHLTLHTTSGALSAQSATINGIAAAPFATSGALAAGVAVVAGTAAHLTLHTTSGDLIAQSAAISSAAAHEHASSGALVAGSAAVAGDADHAAAGGTHDTSGSIVAQSATIDGSANHLTLHTTTGDLVAQSAQVSGDAEAPTEQLSVTVGGNGGRRARQRPRYKINPQLPIQQDPEELPGEGVDYQTPASALPIYQFGDEVDERMAMVNADIAAIAAELDKRQIQLKQQIQDFEDILTYL